MGHIKEKQSKKSSKRHHQKANTLAVIPCYNEEATIGSVILKTKRFVNEVLVIDESFAEPIFKGENSPALKKIAKLNGFINLRKAGLDCVLRGTTSLQEIYRVIGA